MAEKDNSEKSKSKSTGRSRAAKRATRKTAAAKETTRAKTTASRKKPAEPTAVAKKKETKTVRPRTRRTKTTAPSGEETGLPAPAEVSTQMPAGGSAQDEGALALAEWGAQSTDNRPLGPRGRTRPEIKKPPREPVPPRVDSELLDIPAWPELSDEPVAAAARPAPLPQRPMAAPPRPAVPPPPRSVAAPARPVTPPPPPARKPEPLPPVEPDDFGPDLEEEIEVESDQFEAEDREATVEDLEGSGESDGGPAVLGEPGTDEEQPRKGRRRRRRRRGRHRNQNGEAQGNAAEQQTEPREQQREPRPAPAQTSRPPRPEKEDRRDRGDRDGSGRDFRREKGPAPERTKPPERGPRADERPRPAPLEEEELGEEFAEPMGDLWTEEVFDEEETEAVAPPDEKNGRLMLINVAEGEECRIAILHQNRLEELFIERASAESHVGNIYKGRVTNVEPSIQAAFVDFGLPKNGFLHISDLQPQYFPGGLKTVEDVGRKTPRRDRPPIQK